jgi:hypothetical protein
MPKAQRHTLTQQYAGRRQILAKAAHAYLCFYEGHPGFDIDWQQQTQRGCRHAAEQMRTGTELTVHCLCEEDFLADILWRMTSGEPAGEPTEESTP